MGSRIITIFSNQTILSLETKTEFVDKLRKAGFHVIFEYDPKAELIACIGGDGAFIHAVHACGFPETPFLGINTGHLGFFQEIQPEDLDAFIENYLNEKYRIQTLITVKARIVHKGGEEQLQALNEIVVRSGGSYTIHFDISIGDSYIERFSGDGICVATPAGSTAYNYSLGGGIVDPRLRALQVTPIAPMNTIAYRCFTSSILLPSELSFGIVPEKAYREISINTDGIEHSFENLKEVRIEISDKVVNLLRFESYDFWNKVKSKFL